MSFPEPTEEHKVRGKPEKFAEHYAQATLFWESQSDIEKQHIIRAFRFELTKVRIVAIRQRVVAQLRNVAEELAQAVGSGLGMIDLPAPLPKLKRTPKPEVHTSGALSLFARPGRLGIKTRRVAILVADGVDGDVALKVHKVLEDEGAVPRFVGVKMGRAQSKAGEPIEVEVSIEAAPSVVWDAVVVVDGESAVEALCDSGQALEFLQDQYRHCKPILLLGAARTLLEVVGIESQLPSGETDPGLLLFEGNDLKAAAAAFAESLTKHRHFQRETDPPRI